MFAATSVRAEEVLAFTRNLTLGTPVKETLEGDANYAKYTFTIPRSGTLTVQLGFMEGSAYSWGHLGSVTLKDLDDKSIANVSVRDNNAGTDSETFTTDIMAGQYYLYIQTECGSNRPSTFTVSTSFVDSQETVVDQVTNPHDNVANPIGFSFNKTYTGHLANNGATDIYVFENKKDCFIQLNTTNRTNGLWINLYNENDTVNREFSFTEKTQNMKVFCPKGKYYINVSRNRDYGVYTIAAKATDLVTTNLKGLYNRKGKLLNVKFATKSVEDANGYQIQYSTKKNFKASKRINVENNSYLKGFYENIPVKKKTYYVRIRTYMKDKRGDLYFSKWSKAKKIKIRK
jgi:hypothetical protein